MLSKLRIAQAKLQVDQLRPIWAVLWFGNQVNFDANIEFEERTGEKMRNGVPVHVNNKKTLHKKDFDTTTKSKQCNYNWPRNTVLLWPCCGLNVKQLQHLVTKGVTIFQLIFYANTLKAVFQWYVFFYVRIRTECSEHVNSFIDAYWAHVRKRTLKNALLEFIAFKPLFFWQLIIKNHYLSSVLYFVHPSMMSWTSLWVTLPKQTGGIP